MKKFGTFAFFLMLSMGLICCGKEEEQPQKNDSAAEITVKNADGDIEPHRKVYVFDQPSTDADGRDPSKALMEAVADENGIVEFNLNTVAEGTLYFTAVEELLTKEFNVLGSVETDFVKGVSIEEELIASGSLLKYKHGYLPNTISSRLAIDEYNRWRNTQVVACNDGLRIVADPSSQTFVEAVGFGMLLSAYAKDKATFDGIFTFYKSKRTPESKNMMGWKVTCDGIIDPGSATDGDLDVALALIVASKQWDEPSYTEAAKEILQIISDNVIKTCVVNSESVYIVGPGYSNMAWGGCQEMDIMYHTPAFFRVFAEITGDEMWNELADDTYVTLNTGAHPTTGLVPDWQTATGTPGPGGRAGHYGYDACRAPWRITLDYLWNGNEKAEAWAKKIAGWAKQTGPTNIVDGHELDGTPIGENGLNSAFLGGFAVATMSHSQETADSFSTELSKLNDNYWFNLNTRVLYLFTLTGNFRDPMEM